MPDETPNIMLDIGLGENKLKVDMHTVSIEPDKMHLDIVWRGAHEYPGIDWLPKMKKRKTKIW